MAYTSMKKLITNENNKLKNGTITQEEYELFKVNSMKQMDVFLACDRITSSQYEELVGMFETTTTE